MAGYPACPVALVAAAASDFDRMYGHLFPEFALIVAALWAGAVGLMLYLRFWRPGWFQTRQRHGARGDRSQP
ncbi:hypothetical protein FKB34_14780 [Glycocaulis profundi]|nr:hypothetical protein FKB34_14780 [Glycocaulis profundi]